MSNVLPMSRKMSTKSLLYVLKMQFFCLHYHYILAHVIRNEWPLTESVALALARGKKAKQKQNKEITMRKIRYGLTLITLLASLSGFTFFGLGSGSLAATASSQHVTTSVAGKSSPTIAIIIKPYCPVPGSLDC